MEGNSTRNNLGLIGVAITLISMFLPCSEMGAFGFSKSASYIQGGNGKIVFILLIIAAIAYFMNKNGIGCSVSAIILFILIADLLEISGFVSESYGLASVTFGFYLMIIGAVIMTASTFINAKKR